MSRNARSSCAAATHTTGLFGRDKVIQPTLQVMVSPCEIPIAVPEPRLWLPAPLSNVSKHKYPRFTRTALFRYAVKRKRILVLHIQRCCFAIRADAEGYRAVGGKTGATVGIVGKSLDIQNFAA